MQRINNLSGEMVCRAEDSNLQATQHEYF